MMFLSVIKFQFLFQVKYKSFILDLSYIFLVMNVKNKI